MISYTPNGVYGTDCVKALRSLPAGSVDLVFADPPFNIGYEYDEYKDRKDSRAYQDWTRKWMKGVADVLKPDGTFWLAIGDEYAAELKLIAQGEMGFVTRSWVIWYYTFGVNCKRKFNRSHAHLFHFVKDPKQFTFNAAEIRVPSARMLVYADRRANPDGRLPDDTWILRPQDLQDGFIEDQDVWYFPRVCGTFKQRAGWHGCQMPELLLDRVIRTSSHPGDVVMDPFAGSGTTLAVAKKLHRKWIGFEISKRYVKQINDRLSCIRPGDSADGEEDPRTSAPQTPLTSPAQRRRARGRRSCQQTRTEKEDSRITFRDEVSKKCAQIAAGNGEFATALTYAFITSSDGFSIDRMLTDPGLDKRFHEVCHNLGIPGSETSWNVQLLALRKTGRLQGLPRRRRTSIPWDDLDQFVFASEIAWQLLAEQRKTSLDGILCNPGLALEFDRIAERFAPGWSPFHYRWGALTLRKKAKEKRKSAEKLPRPLSRRSFARQSLATEKLGEIPIDGGLYLLKAADQNLYLGETSVLRRRLENQCGSLDSFLESLGRNDVCMSDVRIRLLPLGGFNRETRWGMQFQALDRLGSKRPRVNYFGQVDDAA